MIGYGQAFTDSIQRNWGSHPYHDLIIGLDYCLEKYDFLDAERVAGLGASYGGYMINWLNGHNTEKRFKAFVNHDGMFNTLESYYTTDELYFHEREVKIKKQGFLFEKRNPYQVHLDSSVVSLITLLFAWWLSAGTLPTTCTDGTHPHLSSMVNILFANAYLWFRCSNSHLIQGARDYRLLYGEGLATFTALQRRGVPSRLLFFPDENHWTLKPANSLKWHKEGTWILSFSKGQNRMQI